MSVSKWRWTEECANGICVGDCDLCDKNPIELPETAKAYNIGYQVGYEDGYDDGYFDAKHEDFHGDFVEVIRCKDCKHRPIFEKSGAGEYVDAPIVAEKKLEGRIGKYKRIERDYTCPLLWDSEESYAMPEGDFFCKYGERKAR